MKLRLSAGLIALLVVVLLAGTIAPVAWMLRLQRAEDTPVLPAEGPKAIAGCENDPEAVNGIGVAIQAVIASHPLGDATQTWRVHSICQKGDWAYAYVKGYARSTGEPLPSPSEVVLLQRTAAGWQARLPEMGVDYNAWLDAIPAAVVPDEVKPVLSQPEADVKPAMRFADYRLPWPAGDRAFVIWHWYPALDFSIGAANQRQGVIRSAKPGRVVFAKDSSIRECGDPPPDWTCWMWGNAVVVQSAPDEYAWYVHLAPNSIPDWIYEGVYLPPAADIGLEGTTGWSAGPHLHFMVASTFSCCAGEGDSRIPDWPFGTSGVDFVEYAWNDLPWEATSANGLVTEIVLPPPDNPTPPPPIPESAPTDVPAESNPAPTPEVQPTATTGCSNPYIVQPGDWLYHIAEVCGFTGPALVAANPAINPNWIQVGQAINLPGVAITSGSTNGNTNGTSTGAPTPAATPPPPAGSTCTGTHTVVPGDTVWGIATTCGLTVDQVAGRNGITWPYTIYPGQVLAFP